MSSLRLTNVLLAIIAICLLVIAARSITSALVPEAHAQVSASPAILRGCYQTLEGTDEASMHLKCTSTPVRVTFDGFVLTRPAP